jgi:hypothetical protein
MSFNNPPIPPFVNYTLTAEKIDEYDVFSRFLKLNPDIAEKYNAHKTYEILKRDNNENR